MELVKINDTLLTIQKEWFTEVILKSKINHPEFSFSNPYVFAINEEYKSSSGKIMIVGQQTADYDKLNESSDFVCEQKWSETYLNKQLTGIGEEKYNRSPFWHFFRRLRKEGFGSCWNNVDSIQRFDNKKAKALTLEMEKAIQIPFGDDHKTLLLKQIEVADPQIIIFVTGPDYIRTLEMALMLKEGSLEDYKPSKDELIKDISLLLFPKQSSKKAFWTYHPNYLYHMGRGTVDKIVGIIKDNSC